jgi:hypothetical protein
MSMALHKVPRGDWQGTHSTITKATSTTGTTIVTAREFIPMNSGQRNVDIGIPCRVILRNASSFAGHSRNAAFTWTIATSKDWLAGNMCLRIRRRRHDERSKKSSKRRHAVMQAKK